MKKTNNAIREISRYTYDWITSYVPTLRTNSDHTTRNYKIAVNLYITYIEELGYDETNFNTNCFAANIVTQWLTWLKETVSVPTRLAIAVWLPLRAFSSTLVSEIRLTDICIKMLQTV